MDLKSKGYVDTDSVLPDFLAESNELLAGMEQSLLLLETEPTNQDAIGSVFRAAHTIKGNAGVFGFNEVVAFTHVVENVLSDVRDGKAPVDAEIIALLLSCRDHIAEKLDGIAKQKKPPSAEHLETDRELIGKLQSHLAEPADVVPSASAQAQADAVSAEAASNSLLTVNSAERVASQNWHISLRMGRDVLRNGMDPLSILHYLSGTGEIVKLVTLVDAIPSIQEMDAETCYLAFEVELQSHATKEQIESTFKFIRDDSVIHILPPQAKIAEYVSLINERANDKENLGEILVACGALTESELATALRLQQAAQESAVPVAQTTSAGHADLSASPGISPSAPLLGEILRESGVVHADAVDAALKKQTQVRENKQPETQYIRIRADKLDQLINRVGELVIAGAGANLVARRAKDALLQEATSVISRLVEEIREDALSLRMVQIGETFNRFQRVVRDVSRELGKNIAMVVSGAETELDKTVVEKITDPLMHLVRNAIDHGIESAQSRKERGKAEQGTLRLNAYHDSGSIVIEVSDDGGGLSKDKILQKAFERGILTGNQSLTDKEIYNLIFEAGFSTADSVTNLSGRGVGMDVVRRNIESLRGTVDLETELGVGTTVRIRLPLTLAIIDGFLVGVGKNSYVIPLDSVVECVELDESGYEAGAERSYVNLRGLILPCVHLGKHFQIERSGRRRENIVVVNYGGNKAGLVVDELFGEFQTVIKPLGKLFGGLRGISGSTILGSGEVALIVDVPVLIQTAAAAESTAPARRGMATH